jgi:transmembrane sensor
MKKYNAAELWNKYREGTCTPEEKAIVESWLLQQLQENRTDLSEEDLEQVGKRIWQSLPVQETQQKERKMRSLFTRYVAAASVLVVVVTGFFFFFHKRMKREQVAATGNNNYPQDIAPGGNKARLTLGDGSTIVLDTAKNGMLATQLNTTIHKTGGMLSYRMPAPTAFTVTDLPVQYNTLSVPRGGQYHIVLADGTGVWMNALSSLRFPVAFTGVTREVELTGEAYFEVAKRKDMPFKVTTQHQEVKVLGTHFVINAYEDEPAIHTTLLEGSVEVTNTNATRKLTLKPGLQTVLSRTTGDMKVQKADTAFALAWKNGYFQFKEEKIESVMRRIARWYDVDIQYQGAPVQQRFVGTISRFENVSKVLRMLQLTEVVNFTVEGKKITVQPLNP